MVFFLMTQVCILDEYEWKKLRRLMKYLFSTMEDMSLHLNDDDLNFLHWWVDVSYGTHPDLKGHTGATILIGKGGITSISKKYKINTTISTISELVGVHKYSIQVLFTKSFHQN